MIKRLAVVLMCSLLLSGSVVKTAEASHGIWPFNYCSGDFQQMGQYNINSWSYMHYEENMPCNVYGWIDRYCDYCSKCGKVQNIKDYQTERHDGWNGIYNDGPWKVAG